MATKELSFDNFFSTTLNGAITSGDLTIELNGVPTASEGFLVIDPATAQEVIYYTSKTSTSVTVPAGAGNGRGYDGSTAAAHNDGTTVIAVPVAAAFEAIQDGTGLGDDIIDSRHYVDGSIDTAHISDGSSTGGATGEKLGTTIAFFATTDTAQSVSNATRETLELEDELFDIGSNYDNTTFKFTCPYAGVYHFDAGAMIDDLNDGDLIDVYVENLTDGSYRRTRQFSNGTGRVTGSHVSYVMDCAANDEIVASVYHNEGAAQPLYVATASFNWFSGYLIGRTD